MGWFEAIPKIFTTVLLLIGLVSLVIFIITTDFTNIEEAPDKITSLVTKHTIPTEATWLSKAVDSISNPYLLLFVIIVILWLFNYFNNGH